MFKQQQQHKTTRNVAIANRSRSASNNFPYNRRNNCSRMISQSLTVVIDSVYHKLVENETYS